MSEAKSTRILAALADWHPCYRAGASRQAIDAGAVETLVPQQSPDNQDFFVHCDLVALFKIGSSSLI